MTRQRVTVSILLAVLIHAAVLLLVQLFVHLAPERMPEYSGPLIVTLQETPVTPVLERVEERQAQAAAQAQAQPVPEQPAPEATAPTAPRAERRPQPQAQPAPQQPAPQRTQPAPVQPAPAQAARPQERPPQGTRQVLPAEPLGTLPPVAPEDTTPYAPQTFSQPLADEGPIQTAPADAAAAQQQAPLLDTSRLDSAIGQPDAGASSAAPAGPTGVSSGTPGTSPGRTVEGFQIEWQNPSEGRLVLQSAQPEIPDEASTEGRTLVVVVSFVLKPSGILWDVRIVTGSGLPTVDTAVVSALRRWRFSSSPGAPDVRGKVTYRIIPR